ncbi:MAG: hypothetical protein ACREAF_01475 [Nitrosopumilaceae archaeon]
MIRSKLFLSLLILFILSPAYVFAEEGTISVDFGKLYEITYDAKDVTVFEIIPNPDDIELIFSVDVTSPVATIEITIPRELLDATENGQDVDFFVIADGDFVTFSEKKSTETTRTIFIQLEPGTTELEVFGTHLAGESFADDSMVEDGEEEMPQEETPQEMMEEESPAMEEQPIEEMQPQEMEQKPEESMEESTPTEEILPSQNMFDFSNLSDWSVTVSKRQMTEFVAAAALFLVLAIVLGIIKGSRTAKALP